MNFKVPNIAPEGNIFIAIFSVITLILFIFSSLLGFIGIVLTVWCALFFRDPDRVSPQKDSLILAPADGKIIKVETIIPPENTGISEESLHIAIFMNVFNVHINRAPCAGTIENIIYNPGLFINASFDKASEGNERQIFVMKTKHGKVAFVQIAGLVARRIVKFVDEGTKIKAGEKFGLIRFGSRVDIYLPKDAQVLVENGQTTIAGETILAEFDCPPKKYHYEILNRPQV